jgi:hypothetical protein
MVFHSSALKYSFQDHLISNITYYFMASAALDEKNSDE